MPEMYRAKLRALVAAITLTSTLALAALGHKAGSETWTPPSGTAGASHVDVVTTADYYGLQVAKLWQYGHAACLLELEESTLATQSLGRLDPLKVCEPTGGEEWKNADVGAGLYVTAIATCTGKDKADTSIHGVELWGSTPRADGKVDPAKRSVKLEFSECKKWQPKRACPAGAIATGIRGYFDDAEHGLTGLALRCHTLEPRGAK
jgi:hypothetical protein